MKLEKNAMTLAPKIAAMQTLIICSNARMPNGITNALRLKICRPRNRAHLLLRINRITYLRWNPINAANISRQISREGRRKLPRSTYAYGDDSRAKDNK